MDLSTEPLPHAISSPQNCKTQGRVDTHRNEDRSAYGEIHMIRSRPDAQRTCNHPTRCPHFCDSRYRQCEKYRKYGNPDHAPPGHGRCLIFRHLPNSSNPHFCPQQVPKQKHRKRYRRYHAKKKPNIGETRQKFAHIGPARPGAPETHREKSDSNRKPYAYAESLPPIRN